ncbi:hypothetical protein AB4Z42_05275 [Mycobacterium sp. 2YAF39]|uniref:hypothetical protein n=1 Tax=Mycobacterium sp. 2YAF39 TaxID=3233033 RepID=UPI003F9833C9
MSTRLMKAFAIFGGSAAVTAAALTGAVLQGQSGSDAIAGSEMTTGVTVTATTAPSGLPVPVAEPSIKGPAPLPLEEQGLPG